MRSIQLIMEVAYVIDLFLFWLNAQQVVRTWERTPCRAARTKSAPTPIIPAGKTICTTITTWPRRKATISTGPWEYLCRSRVAAPSRATATAALLAITVSAIKVETFIRPTLRSLSLCPSPWRSIPLRDNPPTTTLTSTAVASIVQPDRTSRRPALTSTAERRLRADNRKEKRRRRFPWRQRLGLLILFI